MNVIDKKVNGFLMVDVQRGDTRVEFHEESHSEQVAGVLVTLLLSYLQQGYRQVTVQFDNARTHGKRMQTEISRLLQDLSSPTVVIDFTVNYWHTPVYSPQLNPAEYVIHAVRRNALYHVPGTLSLADKIEQLRATTSTRISDE